MQLESRKTVLKYMKSGQFLQRLQMLRFARDWQDVLYDEHVVFFWDRTCLRDTITELESATGQPWLGRETDGRKVFRSDGFYIDARDPVGLHHGAGHRYTTTVQVQGSAFSRGVLLSEALDEIEVAIFRETRPERRRMGRTDLAFDIWIREGEPFEPLELLRAIHRWGNGSEAHHRDWKTHLRAVAVDAKIVGGQPVETFYLGSRSVAMLRCYRKDVEFEGNTALHLGPVWRLGGYDGSGVVLRLEFEIKREYLRTHALPNGVPLVSLGWENWEHVCNALLGTLVDTVVHCPEYDPDHPDRAQTSMIWYLLQAYSAFARPAPRCVRFYAEPDEIETALALERAVWRAQEVLGTEEANRLIDSASAPTVPRVGARRANWENGYLWTGYHDRRVYDARREEQARRQGGQYEIEFGGRAKTGPAERRRRRAGTASGGAREEAPEEDRRGARAGAKRGARRG